MTIFMRTAKVCALWTAGRDGTLNLDGPTRANDLAFLPWRLRAAALTARGAASIFTPEGPLAAAAAVLGALQL